MSLVLQSAPKISGVVLAGGLGRRVGGRDKGLLDYRGRPLAQQAAERLAPQVDELFISANRNAERYAAFGHVLADRFPGFAGPLAGLAAALAAARHPLVASVPCDSPHFPEDLVARLCQALLDAKADIAVAETQGRLHPVFCLCRQENLPALTDYLARGGRRMMDWQASQHRTTVNFDNPDAFCNLNTQEEML